MRRKNDVIGLRRLTCAEPSIGDGVCEALALLFFLARWGAADRERFREKIAHALRGVAEVTTS